MLSFEWLDETRRTYLQPFIMTSHDYERFWRFDDAKSARMYGRKTIFYQTQGLCGCSLTSLTTISNTHGCSALTKNVTDAWSTSVSNSQWDVSVNTVLWSHPPPQKKRSEKRGKKRQRNYRWQENRPCLSSLFLINSSSLPALRSTVINVMERGRGAYISLCISVMYMGEIRGEGGRERERVRDMKTPHFYSVTFTAVGII